MHLQRWSACLYPGDPCAWTLRNFVSSSHLPHRAKLSPRRLTWYSEKCSFRSLLQEDCEITFSPHSSCTCQTQPCSSLVLHSSFSSSRPHYIIYEFLLVKRLICTTPCSLLVVCSSTLYQLEEFFAPLSCPSMRPLLSCASYVALSLPLLSESLTSSGLLGNCYYDVFFLPLPAWGCGRRPLSAYARYR